MSLIDYRFYLGLRENFNTILCMIVNSLVISDNDFVWKKKKDGVIKSLILNKDFQFIFCPNKTDETTNIDKNEIDLNTNENIITSEPDKNHSQILLLKNITQNLFVKNKEYLRNLKSLEKLCLNVIKF